MRDAIDFISWPALASTLLGLEVDPTHLRQLRDRAALSDVILLGTEVQVRLAAQAASDLAAGRPVEISELVVSLRNFIREVLDLDPVPADVAIPKQGPLRPAATGRGGGGAGGGAAMLGGGALGAGLDPDDRP